MKSSVCNMTNELMYSFEWHPERRRGENTFTYAYVDEMSEYRAFFGEDKYPWLIYRSRKWTS